MHDSNAFSTVEKIFYRPIEAAIRWSDLIAHEREILNSPWDDPQRLINTFPQWPRLHSCLAKILDAIRNREMPYGALGITVAPGTAVDYRLLTVRHSDLKYWMVHYHPDQHPSFLFSHNTPDQQSIHYSTYLILQADRDALQTQLEATKKMLESLTNELKAVGLERENLRFLADNRQPLSDRTRSSFLNVIGALVDAMLGSSPAGRKNSVFDSQASIVDYITAHYSSVEGLSKRSLDEKFAASRRNLTKAKNAGTQ